MTNDQAPMTKLVFPQDLAMHLKRALLLLVVTTVSVSLGFGQSPENDPLRNDYSQWKLAAGAGKLAEPVSISTRPGFEVEIVRNAAPGEGSWISLTFDDRGRLLVGREDKGILRFTFDEKQKTVERLETVNDSLLEPRGLLIAHDSLYVTANNSKGLYRLRDTDGDDRYDQVQLLRQLEGLVGHGRNGMALGPDGKIYVALGNNVKIPADVSPQSPYRGSQLDRLLPCAWNEFLFDNDVTPPAGHIARTDADGKTWEIVAGGFRNPYDLAFNGDGQLFTYDADMEWDIGAPWYRSTCVMHVVPGGEYGWRQGTSVWPDHFADSLPRVADVGLGSPTGVVFGDKSHFPAPYRNALFILDWAYGRILAVHLSPKGASYTGRVETFLKGKPLNVTDATFGPDGSMYFLVGGRGTRSALYRVRYTGDGKPTKSEEPTSDAAGHRHARQALEPLLTGPTVDALETIWSHLASDEPFIRHTARTALERLPMESWRGRAIQEQQPRPAIQALMAWARVGSREQQPDLVARLTYWLKQPLEESERLAALRTAQLTITRLGSLSAEQAAHWQKILEPAFPAKTAAENYLLAELLVALDSPEVVKHTLSLIPGAESDRQRLWYLYVLRQAKQGWSLESRRTYLHCLKEAEKFAGAHYLPRFIIYIRTDALASFTDAERQALATEIDLLGRLPDDNASSPLTTRAEVQKWTLETLTAELAKITRPVDVARGAKLYVEAQCVRCHRFGKEGIPFGPDLTQVASRFSQRDVLDAVLQPSRVIDDKYRTLLLESEDGLTVSGFLVGGNAEEFYVAPDPLHPTTFRRIPRHQIAQRKVSPLSPMPEGLFNTFKAEEIYDLLGVLLAQ
jgi:putative heme-binding domain-containing protein